MIRGSLLQKGLAADAQGEAPWSPRSPRKMLVIGLGSSTMALWLRKHYPDTTLHVAELVPSVVASAPCFGLDTNDPGLHLHAADGRAFLKNSTDGQYDAILIDAFDPDAGVPSCFRTKEFFCTRQVQARSRRRPFVQPPQPEDFSWRAQVPG